MDTDVVEVKEKSKEVSQRKGEDLNLDYIYDNSPLAFEKPMSSGSKRVESQESVLCGRISF